MKIKNKGKVYPSPSSSSSSSSSSCSNAAGGGGDYLSVLKLLPAAIIAFVSVLPLDDRDVLAYLIMRSIKTTTTATTSPNPPSFSQKKPTKKAPNNTTSGGGGLYCDCFDCYTSFWFRWDSSPNRELIHQAIEAFEDHLTSGETEKSKKNAKAKRRDKTARRFAANDSQPIDFPGLGQPESSVPIKPVEVIEQSSASDADVALPENEVAPAGLPEKKESSAEENELACVFNGSPPPEAEEEVVRTAVAAVTTQHKGLARKVLPDVLGLFNSRLWSLWSPNV